MIGTFCIGIFASKMINPAGADGLIYGGYHLLLNQMTGIAVVGVYAFVVSWVLLKVIDRLIGVRVNEESENLGLDLTEHSESAYSS